jgi:hypothetical protein
VSVPQKPAVPGWVVGVIASLLALAVILGWNQGLFLFRNGRDREHAFILAGAALLAVASWIVLRRFFLAGLVGSVRWLTWLRKALLSYVLMPAIVFVALGLFLITLPEHRMTVVVTDVFGDGVLAGVLDDEFARLSERQDIRIVAMPAAVNTRSRAQEVLEETGADVILFGTSNEKTYSFAIVDAGQRVTSDRQEFPLPNRSAPEERLSFAHVIVLSLEFFVGTVEAGNGKIRESLNRIDTMLRHHLSEQDYSEAIRTRTREYVYAAYMSLCRCFGRTTGDDQLVGTVDTALTYYPAEPYRTVLDGAMLVAKADLLLVAGRLDEARATLDRATEIDGSYGRIDRVRAALEYRDGSPDGFCRAMQSMTKYRVWTSANDITFTKSDQTLFKVLKVSLKASTEGRCDVDAT